MSIVILRQDDKIEVWKKALEEKAPQIPIYNGQLEHPDTDITMALVWKHPEKSLLKYPNLKCISSLGAGVDFIFDDEHRPKNIPVTRVVDQFLASDMSEYVSAVIFDHLKQLSYYKLSQSHSQWNPKPYKRIKDCTVGILGMGVLGRQVAKDLVRFGFTVQGWSSSPKQIEDVADFTGTNDLPDFLATTNILVCLLPLTPRTKGILNAELLAQLPPASYLINAARGAHLIEEDLLSLLNNGQLSGACLDVFHTEPLPKNHLFWSHPKILITPHVASVSDTASVVPQILENYERLRKGQSLLNEVSKEKGY